MKEHKRYNIGILIGGVHTYFPKEHILGIAEAAEELCRPDNCEQGTGES